MIRFWYILKNLDPTINKSYNGCNHNTITCNQIQYLKKKKSYNMCNHNIMACSQLLYSKYLIQKKRNVQGDMTNWDRLLCPFFPLVILL